MGRLLGNCSVFLSFVGVIFLLSLPHSAGDSKALFSMLWIHGHRFNFVASDVKSCLALECVDDDGSVNEVPSTLGWNVFWSRSA